MGQGYTDFENVDFYRVHGIIYYYAVGTTLSCIVLAVGLAYIVGEYCTQSHLATEDFGNACQGMRFTRLFKKYTYWLRLLLDLWDAILLMVWRLIRYPWHKVTGRQPTRSNKTLVWDWKAKPRSADGRPVRGLSDRARRRSSTRPLMEGEQEGRSSRDSRSPNQWESEGPAYQTDNSAQHDTRDEGPSRIRMPTLQLPAQMHPKHAASRPPSPSSDTS